MTKTYLASVAAGALVLVLTTAANAAVRRHEAVSDMRPALQQRYAEPNCSLDGQLDGNGYCFFQSGSKVSAARSERPVAY
jgi:hypothetical protein